MEKNFEITKVNVTVLHKIERVNYKWLPAYSELCRISVYYNQNGEKWRTTFYTLISEPIDIEGSIRDYYSSIKDGMADEIYYNCPTYDDLKKYKKECIEALNNCLQ